MNALEKAKSPRRQSGAFAELVNTNTYQPNLLYHDNDPHVKEQSLPSPLLVAVLEEYWQASLAGDDARAQDLAHTYRTMYGRLHHEPPRQTLPPRLPCKAEWTAYKEQQRRADFDRRLAELEASIERNSIRLAKFEREHFVLWPEEVCYV